MYCFLGFTVIVIRSIVRDVVWYLGVVEEVVFRGLVIIFVNLYFFVFMDRDLD